MTQKDKVHPAVQFIRTEYKLTWKSLGALLSDRMQVLGYEASLSPANVRNFATGRSSAWWFWARISEIITGAWVTERGEAQTPLEIKKIDLKYSALFSEDLAIAYAFWHEAREMSQENTEGAKAIEYGLLMAASITNSVATKFDATFPKVAIKPHFR